MNIYSCDTAEVTFSLTWEQMKAKEGVYTAAGRADLRFIVLKGWAESAPGAVLLIMQDVVHIAVTESWNKDKFKRLEEANFILMIR